MIAPALLTLAWGVLSFGAVYPWGYWPLAWGAFVAGALGVFGGSARGDRAPGVFGDSARGDRAPAVLAALALLLMSVGIQLIPLGPALVRAVSPATMQFAESYVELPPEAAAVAGEPLLGAPATGSQRFLSVAPGATARALLILAALACLVFGGTTLDARGARRLAVGVLVLGVGVACLAIVQRAYRGPLLGFWEPRFGSGNFGPFVNRNHFAGWMVMASSLGLGYFFALSARLAHGGGGSWRGRFLRLFSNEASPVMFVGLGLAVMAVSVLLTLSRSGFICLGLAGLLVGAAAQRRRAREHATYRPALVAAALALLVVGTAGWTSLSAVSERFAKTGGIAPGGRMLLWRDAFEVVKSFPVAGTGLNTYTLVSPFFQATGAAPSSDEAHNDYLQLAAEGGLLVGVPAIVLIVLFAGEVRRRFRSNRGAMSHWLRVGAIAGLIAMAVQETVEFSLQIPGNAALFALLCAVALHRPDTGDELDATITARREPALRPSIWQV